MTDIQQTATYDQVRTRIREYVLALVGLPDMADDQPLITDHVLDSIAAVQMVAFVEGAFGLQVEDEDLELRHFDTIDGLVGLVTGKLGLR